jgi:hypothetical protein
MYYRKIEIPIYLILKHETHDILWYFEVADCEASVSEYGGVMSVSIHRLNESHQDAGLEVGGHESATYTALALLPLHNIEEGSGTGNLHALLTPMLLHRQ